MKVEKLMTRTVHCCYADEPLNRAAHIMWEHDCGVVPVVAPSDGGEHVVGMLTDRDICMAAYTQGRALTDIPIASAMSKHVFSCRPSDDIAVAIKVMEANQVRRLPVADEQERLVGLLSLSDLAREALCEHGTTTPQIPDATVGEALEIVSAPRSASALVAAA